MATEPLGRTLTGRRSGLDQAALAEGVEVLAGRDERLGRLRDRNGVPPLWGRTGGFATLVKIVLEQQVSLDSAAAAYANLERAIGTVEPTAFLTLGDAELKRIGFSRQKAGYCRGIAEQSVSGTLDFDDLGSRTDREARSRLLEVKGIGPWTADVYLLFALRRPDVWPNGDRALVVSMAESLPLDEIPNYHDAARLAASWQPWRSVAARLLWHAYLIKRDRSLD